MKELAKEKKVGEIVGKLKEQVARCKTARFNDDESTTWFEAQPVLPRVDAEEVGSITKTLKARQQLNCRIGERQAASAGREIRGGRR